MLTSGDGKVDTPDAGCVVMDVPWDCRPLELAFTPVPGVLEASPKDGTELSDEDVIVFSAPISLELVSWCISDLCCPCCCCCSSVVPTWAGGVFPKWWFALPVDPTPLFSEWEPAGLLWPTSCDSREPTRSLTAFSSTSEKSISSRGSEAPAMFHHRALSSDVQFERFESSQ